MKQSRQLLPKRQRVVFWRGIVALRSSVAGQFGLTLACVLGSTACTQPGEEHLHSNRALNVLLLTLDTTRADRIGCYGREKARTPVLDRLAERGFLFVHCTSSNPVTQPAHATILTGVYPMVHGVRDNTYFRLPDQARTLAEILKDARYATGAAIGGFPLTKTFGTAQGFDYYNDDLRANRVDHRGRPAARQFASWYDERPAGHVNDAMFAWLREPRHQPFFAWLHYWDPHYPHIAPTPYRELFAHSPYDGEIAYVDASLGRVLDQLKRMGELERTVVVVTADHGEGFYEHQEATHAFLAYDSTLRVPLIVVIPGVRGGRRISERTGTVDIVPTILDLVGVGIPSHVQGRSLKALMLHGRGVEPQRAYYAESLSPRLSHGYGELRVLMQGPWKYIFGPRPELFDTTADPRELHDLTGTHVDRQQSMERHLQRFVREHARSTVASEAVHEVGRETRAALEALGYLSSGGEEARAVEETLLAGGDAPQDRVSVMNQGFHLRQALAARQWNLARTIATKAVSRSPQNPHHRGSLAAALAGLGELDKALAVMDGTKIHSQANHAPFLAVCHKLFEAGEKTRAIHRTRQLMRAYPTAKGFLLLALMLRKTGDVEEAHNVLESAKNSDPNHYGVRLALVRSYLDRDLIEPAKLELEELLDRHPVDVDAQLEAVRLLVQQGRRDAALARLQRVLRIAPNHCDALLRQVQVAVSGKHREDARVAMAALRQRCRNSKTIDEGATLMGGLP
jgi:arylsulfatase A-like enzyme/thioredoxin-like negative regulator of GroEL